MCSFVPCSHFLGCGNVARGRWRKGLKPLRRWEGQSAPVSEGLGKAKVREQSGVWMLRAVLWVPRKCPRAPLWTGLRRGGQNCRPVCPGRPRQPPPAQEVAAPGLSVWLRWGLAPPLLTEALLCRRVSKVPGGRGLSHHAEAGCRATSCGGHALLAGRPPRPMVGADWALACAEKGQTPASLYLCPPPSLWAASRAPQAQGACWN